jgi:hypothetical protein
MVKVCELNIPEVFRLAQNRALFSIQHPCDPDDWSHHPDTRSIPCSTELVRDYEWSERVGNGYVLPDGAWYDPCTKEFFGINTIY